MNEDGEDRTNFACWAIFRCHKTGGFEESFASSTASERCSADPDTFGDGLECQFVVLLGLIGETEKEEEDEGAENNAPATHFQRNRGVQVGRLTPQDGGNLIDARKIGMDTSPTDPRVKGPNTGLKNDTDDVKRYID